MGSPIYNPPVPFDGPIYGGFGPGRMVRVQGRVTSSAHSFAINLQTGPSPHDDIALHLNPRFAEQTIVRNSRISSSWGAEERHGPPMPITRDQNFEILIMSEAAFFKIAVNGQHFGEFAHRLHALDRVDHLRVEGDLTVSIIQIEGNAAPTSAGYAPTAPPPMGYAPHGGGLPYPSSGGGLPTPGFSMPPATGASPYPPPGGAGYPPPQQPYGGYPPPPQQPYGGYPPQQPGGYPPPGGGYYNPGGAAQPPGGYYNPGGAAPPYGGSGSGSSGGGGGLMGSASKLLAGGLAGVGLAKVANKIPGMGGGHGHGGGGYPGGHHGGGGGGGGGGMLGGLLGPAAALGIGGAVAGKGMKKGGKKNKLLKYGVPVGGAVLGGYALKKGMKGFGHHGHHGHGSSSSSSSSSEEE